MRMPEFQAIGAACKRIRNILRQATEKEIEPGAKFEYLPEAADEEKSLMAIMESTMRESRSASEARRSICEALLLLSTAREPVDRFFDKVMVMVEDDKCGQTGWHCLQTLLKEFSTIADFSEIVTEGKVTSGSLPTRLRRQATAQVESHIAVDYGGHAGATKLIKKD